MTEKESVIKICSNLLLENEKDEAKEACDLANDMGMEIDWEDIEDMADLKLEVVKELVL